MIKVKNEVKSYSYPYLVKYNDTAGYAIGLALTKNTVICLFNYNAGFSVGEKYLHDKNWDIYNNPIILENTPDEK